MQQKRSRVFGPPWPKPPMVDASMDNGNYPFAGIFRTGATGLEPATSGVTGRRSKPITSPAASDVTLSHWRTVSGMLREVLRHSRGSAEHAANERVLVAQGDWIAPRRSSVRVRLAPSLVSSRFLPSRVFLEGVWQVVYLLLFVGEICDCVMRQPACSRGGDPTVTTYVNGGYESSVTIPVCAAGVPAAPR